MDRRRPTLIWPSTGRNIGPRRRRRLRASVRAIPCRTSSSTASSSTDGVSSASPTTTAATSWTRCCPVAGVGSTPSFPGQVGPDVLAAAIDMGMEGVVAKHRSSVYRPGRRSPDWVKTKPEHTQEVVVGDWIAGERARRGTFGALVLGIPYGGGGTRPLRFVGKVGTGLRQRHPGGSPTGDAPAGAGHVAVRTGASDVRRALRHLGPSDPRRRGPVPRVDGGRPTPTPGVAWSARRYGTPGGGP